jgi:uncharacterized protein with ParB-like and HNH nuclease domain
VKLELKNLRFAKKNTKNMANTNLFTTHTVTFNEIMGNGKIHKVPLFQRDYSWDEDNWDDLWSDLMNAHTHDEAHYMGSFVLQVEGDERDKVFWIIDGQQRITTLSIVVLAVIQNLKELIDRGVDPESNKERVGLFMNYLGQKDPTSLMYSSKLFLNKNNDGFYQRHLVNFRAPIAITKLKDSEKLLWKAYEFFLKRIRDNFGVKNDGSAIAAFLNKTVGELLKFIQITVKDELNSYAVFETLNSRGLDLTSTDLLKNYLFMMVSKSRTDLELVEEQWNKIVSIVGLKEFPVFLRHFMNTRDDLVSKEQLFKRVKQLVKKDTDVIKLLDELELFAIVYAALSDPNDDLWKSDKELVEYIDALKLFRVTVCHPLLMICYDKLNAAEFKKILRGVVQLSFRYNVIAKLQSKDMERAYNKTATRIFRGELTTSKDILQDLQNIYLDDNEFRQYFELANFDSRNSQQKKILRYILYKIEAQLTGGVKADYELDNGTIEHILPDSLSEDWKTFFTETEHEKLVYRIGNLTLLEPSKNNKEAARKPFDDKKMVFATSRYAMTRDITVTEWTPKTLQHRQESLGKTASGIWRLIF